MLSVIVMNSIERKFMTENGEFEIWAEESCSETLLTPKQVAELFHVTPKTVSRWARSGKIGATVTVGGHRRYNGLEIYKLLRDLQTLGVVSSEPPR